MYSIGNWTCAIEHRYPQQAFITRQPLLQRVAGRHVTPGPPAQRCLCFRIVQHLNNAPGDGFVIKEIDPPSIFAMTQHFADGCGIGTDDQAAAGHGFEHGPRQDERIGQVNMGRRYLKHAAVGVVRQFAEEVGTCRGERDVAGELFPPVGGILGTLTVADIVAADDQGMAGRVPLLNDSQGAQEMVDAPVGFEVAGNVGDDRFACLEPGAVGQGELRLRVGAEAVGIDAFVAWGQVDGT